MRGVSSLSLPFASLEWPGYQNSHAFPYEKYGRRAAETLFTFSLRFQARKVVGMKIGIAWIIHSIHCGMSLRCSEDISVLNRAQILWRMMERNFLVVCCTNNSRQWYIWCSKCGSLTRDGLMFSAMFDMAAVVHITYNSFIHWLSPLVDFFLTPWNDAVLVTPWHTVCCQWNSEMALKHCRSNAQ